MGGGIVRGEVSGEELSRGEMSGPQSAQATAGKGLAQGLYMAARAGVEPMTLRLKVIVSTKVPPHPIFVSRVEIHLGQSPNNLGQSPDTSK